MKQSLSLLPWFVSLALMLLVPSASRAGEKVMLKEGEPVRLTNGKPALKNGKVVPLEENLQLTPHIQVTTNGTYIVDEGEPRELQEGEVIDDEGMLTSPDGTVRPVLDHLRMKAGQVILFKDGQGRPLQQTYTLPNGTRVKPDGEVRLPNNRLRRLIDGQILATDGSIIQPKDSVMLRDGKVFIQRDGSQFPLPQNRTMMMNDGSKVYGTGKIEKRNGEVIQLEEGKVIHLPGPKLDPGRY